jgi:hypothetical protein
MLSKSMKIIPTMTATLVILSVSFANAEDGPAAVVADFERADLVTLGSRPHTRKVELGTAISAGEPVQVAKGGYLKLVVNGECVAIGERKPADADCTLHPSDSETYVVPESGLLSGMAARYQRFQKVLSWWDPKTETRAMRSREGLAAQIPALAASEEALLMAGKRDLHIRWVDGVAPFEVSIEDKDGLRISAQATGTERDAILPVSIEDGGVYRLTLKSAGDVAATYVLKGQPAGSLKMAGNAEPIIRAMTIMEEVSRSEGAWALEAAQQFHMMSLDDRIRQAALNAVTFGDWP